MTASADPVVGEPSSVPSAIFTHVWPKSGETKTPSSVPTALTVLLSRSLTTDAWSSGMEGLPFFWVCLAFWTRA